MDRKTILRRRIASLRKQIREAEGRLRSALTVTNETELYLGQLWLMDDDDEPRVIAHSFDRSKIEDGLEKIADQLAKEETEVAGYFVDPEEIAYWETALVTVGKEARWMSQKELQAWKEEIERQGEAYYDLYWL